MIVSRVPVSGPGGDGSGDGLRGKMKARNRIERRRSVDRLFRDLTDDAGRGFVARMGKGVEIRGDEG